MPGGVGGQRRKPLPTRLEKSTINTTRPRGGDMILLPLPGLDARLFLMCMLCKLHLPKFHHRASPFNKKISTFAAATGEPGFTSKARS